MALGDLFLWHAGGTAHRDRPPPCAYRLVDLYRATARLTPRDPPGGAARYSTFGIALLGQLLANATDQPYEPLLTERVCHPLGLTTTAAELLGEASPLRATGHRRGRPVPAWQLDALTSSGGLRCTGVDLLAYLHAHLKLRPLRWPAQWPQATSRVL